MKRSRGLRLACLDARQRADEADGGDQQGNGVRPFMCSS
jgi:hypothetical protein